MTNITSENATATSTPTKLSLPTPDGNNTALLPSTTISPRTSQDIKDELKFKVWAAAANGTENGKALPSTTVGTPLQQIQPPPHLRQPLRQIEQCSPPLAPLQTQAAIQGDGGWNDRKAEDLKKRLAQVGVPATSSTAAPPHLRRSAAMASPTSAAAAIEVTSSGASVIPHLRQNAAIFSPLTATTTTAGTVNLQENSKPEPAPAPAASSYRAPECWPSW